MTLLVTAENIHSLNVFSFLNEKRWLFIHYVNSAICNFWQWSVPRKTIYIQTYIVCTCNYNIMNNYFYNDKWCLMFCFWSLTDSITFNHIANIIKKYKKYVRIDTTLSFFLIKLSEFSFSLVYPKLFGHRKGSKGVFTASDTQISILLLMSILKNDKTVTVLLKGT